MALRSPPSLILRASRFAAFAALCVAQFALADSARATSSLEILTSRDPADPLVVFEDRLKEAIAPAATISFTLGSTGPGVLPAVLADRNRLAFAQRDGLAAFRSTANGAAALEIYGDVPACAVALVRRNGLLQSHVDLLAARRNAETVRVDVGPADGWTAATMSNLSSLDATLAHATVEHRGGARALSRVISGETDMLVAMAYGPALDPAITRALEDGALQPATVFTDNLIRLATVHGLPYSTGTVALPGAGLFAGMQDYGTICTSLGVVVNADADNVVAETVARIAVSGTLTPSTGLWLDNALKVAGRVIMEVRRAAWGAAEPGLVWLARWAMPASTSSGAVLRPASNLKDDGSPTNGR